MKPSLKNKKSYKRLNIGCGVKILPKYINLDMYPHRGVDIVHDLEKIPYPFNDGEFYLIEAHQVLEHIDNLQGAMKELARILKKGGKLKLDVPHFTSSAAYKDITHKNYFAYISFFFFTKQYYKNHSYYYPFDYFSKIKVKIKFHKGLMLHNYVVEPLVNIIIKMREGDLYENTFLKGLFPAWRLEVELTK